MEVPVVPAPVAAEAGEGAPFAVRPGIRVVAGRDPGAVSTAVLLATRISADLAAPVPVLTEDDRAPGAIVLRLTTDPGLVGVPRGLAPALAAEAYRIRVDARRVTVVALDAVGLQRGLTTLDQLGRRDADGTTLVPPVVVTDHPRFAWRGLSLDVARHWFDLRTLQGVVDVLASLKMNVLHLHLTDDQGWRLHVPSRPDLTARSGRGGVAGDRGGFLSVADWAELGAYATARAVTVVPEIDTPGHVNAALHAYGELSPSGEPAPAYTGVGVGFSRLHAELPATGPFITSVLGDVAAMTAGPYVHIGGDEAGTMHPAEYDQLVGLAVGTVRAAGKTVVGWQEVARVALPPGSVVQLWDVENGTAEVLDAVARGARVLLSPARRTYLDMRYDATTPIGQDWAGHIGLADAYDWEPADVLAVPPAQLMGVEAALWTETVRTPTELYLLLLPRLAATAEVGWSAPARRDLDRFRARVRRLGVRWDAAGIPWYRAAAERR